MSEPEYDDDYLAATFSDDEEELDVAKLDEDFGGADEEEQAVVEIIPLKKLKQGSKSFRDDRKLNLSTRTNQKSDLVLDKKTIEVSIDILLAYLLRINDSIKPSVAQEIETKIVERSEVGGLKYFVDELAKYLTVFGFAKEVHFDKLIGELSQPEVNVTNVIQSVTDNASQFSENLVGQKRSEIYNVLNSVLNPTVRKQTVSSNTLRLQPLKEIVLYVPTVTQVDEQVVMEEQGEAIQEEEETASSDFIFFMNVLDTYQRQSNQEKLNQLTKMKAIKSKSKTKTKFDTMQEEVNRIYRIRRESEKQFLAQQIKEEEQDRKRAEDEEKAKAKVVVEPKKKPGRPAGGSTVKKYGGKQLSPEVIEEPEVGILCTNCKIKIGDIQLRSIQKNSNQYEKIPFCTFTCLNDYNFISKKEQNK